MRAVRAPVAAWCVVVGAAACGDPAARVSLVPVGGGACGAPATATGLKIIAYGATAESVRAVGLDETLAIDDFPADTLAIGVEVLGAGGATVALGKTAPLAFDELADGATIPVFMAPPEGACALPDRAEARTRPIVAAAADGVLIMGGVGAGGGLLSSAERYDPATATFVPVTVPSELVDPDNGLAGGVLTSMPDGRVVLTGTARGVLAIYDPVTHAFGTPVLTDRRALHAAIALDADHLLVAGGCLTVDHEACSGLPLRSTFVYQLSDLSHVGGAVLGDGDPRTNGTLFALGPRALDGAPTFAFASGAPEPGRTARFALSDANALDLPPLPAQVVALDGGALLAAYGADGSGSATAATLVGPATTTGAPIAKPPPADGARLVTFEDGRVLALGGTADGTAAIYDPTLDAWDAHVPVGDPLGSLVAPTLLRLADGSVLVLAAGAPAHAWIYRPSIVGPQSGTVVALPDGSTGGVLTAPEPSTVTRPASRLQQTLTAPATEDPTLPARLLVGGPRTATGSVEAVVSATSGAGVALVAQELGPGRALIARLVPGQPATIARTDAAHAGASCTGPIVAAFATSTTLGFDVHAGVATVSRDHIALLSCPVDADPDVADAGAWGIAAAGPGASIDVFTVTVRR